MGGPHHRIQGVRRNMAAPPRGWRYSAPHVAKFFQGVRYGAHMGAPHGWRHGGGAAINRFGSNMGSVHTVTHIYY